MYGVNVNYIIVNVSVYLEYFILYLLWYVYQVVGGINYQNKFYIYLVLDWIVLGIILVYCLVVLFVVLFFGYFLFYGIYMFYGGVYLENRQYFFWRYIVCYILIFQDLIN